MTHSPPGKGANRDPKLRMIRKAMTAATTTHGIGGRLKSRPRPKPTLPKLKCLEGDDRPVVHANIGLDSDTGE